ncbi:MAG: M48 family metallopeptidase, partial [Deltaproteobacteria bacterium]|nr:M48 family metallopeptidase [Deltaproteobacteria bacterium]
NRADVAYCNLCKESFTGHGISSLAGPPGTSPVDAPAARHVPMLPFNEAARSNVRMSRFLFLLLFAAFFGLGGVIGKAYESMELGLALALILYSILAASAYFSGSSIVLSIHDAREADPAKHRQLLNVVEEMKIASGIPMPRVYVMETQGMNAFAAGRKPGVSVVAVTTGLMDRLNREELQGVVAHEMAHIKSRDTLYNICAAVLVGAIVLLSDMFLRDAFFFRGRGRTRGGSGGRGNPAFLLLGILLAILAPVAAKLLQMSISRQREYHADAAAAEFTRNPLGLASALEKISAVGAGVPGENRGTQHLFIVNPLRSFTETDSALMSTHPPTELRIRRLKAMAGTG